MPKSAVQMGLAGIWGFGLAFGLGACSESSGTAPSGDDVIESSDAGNSGAGSSTSAKSSSSVSKVSSSSKKAETVSSEEELNEAAMVVNGTCGPKNPIIEKGGVATWEFYRESGDVFDAIIAPYVWNFADMSKVLKGNGMNTVNVTYKEPGTYNAVLNVDGTDITCSPLQVQGIPITIGSCSADKEIAKAGETITWNVKAESEAKITGYSWSSDYGTVSESGTSASMVATSEMHKKSVSVTVAVTNNDKTTQTYLCEGVTVLDPEIVDLVLPLKNINDFTSSGSIVDADEKLFIPGNTAMTIQIPAGAKANCTVGCKPRNGADSDKAEVIWNGVSHLNDKYNFNPEGCAAGVKYQVSASVTVICSVNPQ